MTVTPRRFICKLLTTLIVACSIAVAQVTERSLESVPLTLFQLTARADLIARIRVKDGSLRLAILDVLDGLKGEAPADRIRLDFRDLNLSPQGQGMVTFRDGEEFILFMSTKSWRKPKEKNRDIFDLTHGRRGIMPLPPEGWGIDVGAVKQLVSLTERGPEEQVLGLRESPRDRESNPQGGRPG